MSRKLLAERGTAPHDDIKSEAIPLSPISHLGTTRKSATTLVSLRDSSPDPADLPYRDSETQGGSSTKKEAAPLACSQTARYDDDDMSDPLEGASKTYAQGKKNNYAERGSASSQQYRTNRDAMIPIHKMIRELDRQGVVNKTHSPFNSPIWPVCKSDGEWRLTEDYRALNEVTPLLSAAVPDMLEHQYDLESKAAK
ncbi:hypothetical protein TURU_112098 [Turdus rufiventris]|nr:hypothetical protein TURU_112098 [Turdus rufiventris]